MADLDQKEVGFNAFSLEEARTLETVARDLVVRLSLAVAQHPFDDDPANPGWQSEYDEDQLRDATLAYAGAILRRRAIEGKPHKNVVFRLSFKPWLEVQERVTNGGH